MRIRYRRVKFTCVIVVLFLSISRRNQYIIKVWIQLRW